MAPLPAAPFVWVALGSTAKIGMYIISLPVLLETRSAFGAPGRRPNLGQWARQCNIFVTYEIHSPYCIKFNVGFFFFPVGGCFKKGSIDLLFSLRLSFFK